MSLQNKISEEIKEALRGQQKLKLSVLRMLQASIKNKIIDTGQKELSDEQIITVVNSEIKKRRDSVSEFEKVGRQDAVQAEKDEIAILMEYMPEQMSEEEIVNLIEGSIAELNVESIKDLGKLMKALMPKVKGKADGNLVNRLVREKLGNL
ncbi:MAG: GatB/YqeY domain-containing protein [Candidatus Dadabacteria bacterium]|nr:GatB/YqeY domain-containing protein [Candidatus Dadabacteria bacterium]NIV41760.1 GatB/YqeY domain-containing protein [Candidatus Dadabacteria bacterium]NIX16670.1 GatB/YqeY domain-containing protein [Candidatus Dadabacteria bacterium]